MKLFKNKRGTASACFGGNIYGGGKDDDPNSFGNILLSAVCCAVIMIPILIWIYITALS